MLTRSTHSVTRDSAASHSSRSLCVTRDECHEADSDLHRDQAPHTPDHSDGDYGDVSHELTSLTVYTIVTNDVTKSPMMAPIVSEAHPELTEEMSWLWLRLRPPAVTLSADCFSSIQC